MKLISLLKSIIYLVNLNGGKAVQDHVDDEDKLMHQIRNTRRQFGTCEKGRFFC
jgi:hypothetical protein